MPRYTTVTPTFNPIDYATRIAPLQEYKQEYDKRAEKLEEQAALADTIGGLIDENQDPRLAGIYKDYMNNMNNVATNLLQTGDLGANRAALYGLRQDYNNKLKPIQQAYNDRADRIKMFDEMQAKDPSYRGNDPRNNSLESYLNGKSPEIFGVSGDKVFDEGMRLAKAHSSRLRTVLSDWGLDENFGTQYFVRAYQMGYNAEQVGDALASLSGKDLSDKSIADGINEMKSAYGFIANTLKQLNDGYGVDRLENDNDKRMIMGRGLDGILAGIAYDYKDERLENKDYMTPYQRASLKLQRDELDWKKSQATNGRRGRGSGSGSGTGRRLNHGLTIYDKNGKVVHNGEVSDKVGVGVNQHSVLQGYGKIIAGKNAKLALGMLGEEGIYILSNMLSIDPWDRDGSNIRVKRQGELIGEIADFLQNNRDIQVYTNDDGNIAVNVLHPESSPNDYDIAFGSGTYDYAPGTATKQEQKEDKAKSVDNKNSSAPSGGSQTSNSPQKSSGTTNVAARRGNK